MNQYVARDPKTGGIIVRGTAAHCAEVLGMKEKSFRAAACNQKYRLYEITNESDDLDFNPAYEEAAAAWDEMVRLFKLALHKKITKAEYRKAASRYLPEWMR